MAKIKGPILVSMRRYVRIKFGEDAWSRFLDAFPPEERAQIAVPVSIEWYDLGLVVRALHVLKDVLGGGHASFVEEFGGFDAEQDLTTIQRVFLSLANPAYILEKSAQYWRRFNDWGEWSVQRDGAKGASGSLHGCPIVDELYCLEITGYMLRMWDLVGAKNPRVVHDKCRARGDDTCHWAGSWD